MIPQLRRTLAAAVLLLLCVAPGALAYEGEVDTQVDVDGPSQAVCPTAIEATVTVVDRDGNPLEGVEVVWSNGDTGVTNAEGKHTTTVQISASLTVEVTANDATGKLVIECITGEVLGETGLPRTDTAPASTPAAAWLAVGALGLLGALGLRRLATRA